MAGILNITATKLLTYYLTSPGLNISIRVSGWNAIQNGSWSIILIHWLELQGMKFYTRPVQTPGDLYSSENF